MEDFSPLSVFVLKLQTCKNAVRINSSILFNDKYRSHTILDKRKKSTYCTRKNEARDMSPVISMDLLSY